MSKEKKQAETVIEINDLVKKYKMFNRKQDRLIETIFPKSDILEHLNPAYLK